MGFPNELHIENQSFKTPSSPNSRDGSFYIFEIAAKLMEDYTWAISELKTLHLSMKQIFVNALNGVFPATKLSNILCP